MLRIRALLCCQRRCRVGGLSAAGSSAGQLSPLPAVTCRYLPLSAVTCRYLPAGQLSPLSAVTCLQVNSLRDLPLPAVTCRQVNSLEQLCINFANERLQLFFLQYVFYTEEKIHLDEEVAWPAIKVPAW